MAGFRRNSFWQSREWKSMCNVGKSRTPGNMQCKLKLGGATEGCPFLPLIRPATEPPQNSLPPPAAELRSRAAILIPWFSKLASSGFRCCSGGKKGGCVSPGPPAPPVRQTETHLGVELAVRDVEPAAGLEKRRVVEPQAGADLRLQRTELAPGRPVVVRDGHAQVGSTLRAALLQELFGAPGLGVVIVH